MEAKLRQLMKHEGINSTRLAELLGIQASGISHIMSGRNKPSFDFLHKLLQRFPQINPDWLILDKGPMYRDGIKSKNNTLPTVGTATLAADPHAGTAHDAGPQGTTGGIATPYNRGVMAGGTTGGGITADTASGELFGPDNNDIIPSAGNPGTINPGTDPGAARFGEHGMLNRDVSVEPQGRGSHHNGQAGPGSAQRPMLPQHSVNLSDSFTRSTSIERIVVFYRDKTFSEYQPE